MDPLSITGLALSAGSIAFQLFGGCVKGFVLLSSAHGFGKDSATHICMLNLQELQLMEWARKAGLLAEPPLLDPRLSEPIVCAVLRELQSLLLDTDKLKSRYKMTYSDEPTPISGSQPLLGDPDKAPSLFKDVVSDSVRTDIMIRAGAIKSTANWPKRVWWAAVDKSKFQQLIQNIRSLIAELWLLLDQFRRNEMSQGLEIVLSHVIGITESLDGIQALQQALLQNTILTRDQVESSTLASVAEMKYRGMQLSPNQQAMRDSSDYGRSVDVFKHLPVDGSSEMSRAFHVNVDIDLIKNFTPIKNNINIGNAIYKGAPVLVELKNLTGTSKSKLLQRVKDLAFLLSTPKDPLFRCLRCCALASNSEETKIAFVFSLPQSLLTTQSPSSHLPQFTSLRSIFSLRPSITIRISLALKLLQSLRWFHAANWLHKDICSENILFPLTESGPDLSEPLIAGFAFSRADTPAAISEQPAADWQKDLYRHPDAMGDPSTAFTKDKDIYALGTVLFEIGEWRSLRSILGERIDPRRQVVPLDELRGVKPWLHDTGVAGLDFRMGQVYSQVVGMMLANVVPESWREGEGAWLAGILDIGVRELGRCVI